tara:strand:+ start:489 stop:677 length:189 start_codon:yes stop_codon:yes gene_type:complete
MNKLIFLFLTSLLINCGERYTYEQVKEKDHLGNDLNAQYKHDHWTGRTYVNYGGGWRLLINN